jgi:hypothetical protein
LIFPSRLLGCGATKTEIKIYINNLFPAFLFFLLFSLSSLAQKAYFEVIQVRSAQQQKKNSLKNSQSH